MAQIDESGVKRSFFSLGNQAQNQYCPESSVQNFIREKWGGFECWDEFEAAGADRSGPRAASSSGDTLCKHMIPRATSCEFCRSEKLLEEAFRSNAFFANLKEDDPSCYRLKCKSPDSFSGGRTAQADGGTLQTKTTKQPNCLSTTSSEAPQMKGNVTEPSLS